jgi:aspartate aminotransferase
LAVSLSKRVQQVKPSPTLAVTARAARLKAEGKDIIGLGAGEPDFDTPVHIADAGVDAIRKGLTRYTAVDGTVELKDAIIAKFKRDNGLTYERSQILVSSGAKQTCFNVCAALLDPGDECVIPAPYWVSYPDMALLADGVPVSVYAGPEQGYKITPGQLAAALTPHTKLLFINSPSNPTGAAYTKAELQALGTILDEHPQVVIASDEMYEHIYWAGEPFTSFLHQLLAGESPALRSHHHHQRRVEGLCHDRLAHRLLRRTQGNRGGDGDHPRPIHLQCLQHFPTRLHRRLEQ